MVNRFSAVSSAIVVGALLVGVVATALDQPTCSEGQLSVQSANPFLSPGCNAEAMARVGDMGIDDMSPCCHVHFACYHTGGTKKATCDKDLRKCLSSLCKTSVEEDKIKKKCPANTKAYQEAFHELNPDAFDKAQLEMCDCVSPTAVPARYMSVGEGVLNRALAPAQAQSRMNTLRNELLDGSNDGKEWRLLYDLYKSHVKGIPKIQQAPKKKKRRDDDEEGDF